MVLKKASANRQHDLRSVFQFTFSDDTFIWLGNAPHTILKTHHFSLVTIIRTLAEEMNDDEPKAI